MISRRLLIASGLTARLPLSSHGTTLAAPSGPVILTITGAIARTHAPVGARLDLAKLEVR